MAGEIMTLAQLDTQVLRILRDPSRVNTNNSAANIADMANRKLQAIYARLPKERQMIAEWSTSGDLTESASTQAFTFPVDTVHPVSFYDNTHRRSIDLWFFGPLPNRYMFLKELPPGPVRAIQIAGLTPGASTLRDGVLWPQVPTGVTPDVECHYYRLPAAMPNSSPTAEYPDLPLEYHDLLIKMTAMEFVLSTDPIRLLLQADINNYLETFGMKKAA